MNPLLLRLAAYVVAAAVIFGAGYTVATWRGNARYEALRAADAEASVKALSEANTRNAAIQTSYETKLKVITDVHEKDLNAAQSSADTLARSLHDYQNRLRTCTLSQSASTASRANEAAARATSDAEIADATRQVFEACSSDAAQLKALQAERESLVQ